MGDYPKEKGNPPTRKIGRIIPDDINNINYLSILTLKDKQVYAISILK